MDRATARPIVLLLWEQDATLQRRVAVQAAGTARIAFPRNAWEGQS
jgi:hypothetical protein